MFTWNFFEKLIAAICASAMLLFTVDLTVPAEEARIYDRVIRLHILANSDSEADQETKLCVRDAILEECGDLFSETSSTEEALAQIEGASERMEQIARRVLRERGSTDDVRAVFGTERYPTREYDGVVFPAGEYYSLRVLIGEGEGHNWWCCLFPPMCMSSSTSEDALDSVGIDTSSGKVFGDRRYSFRLKLLEWFSCFID